MCAHSIMLGGQLKVCVFEPHPDSPEGHWFADLPQTDTPPAIRVEVTAQPNPATLLIIATWLSVIGMTVIGAILIANWYGVI